MNQLDIHPEHLIDRVLRGLASESERNELAAHLHVCRACAAEQQLAAALREPLDTGLAGIDQAASSTSAAVDAALSALIDEGRLLPSQPSPNRAVASSARAWLPWAAGLCLFFTGSAAAATLIMAVRSNSDANAPATVAPASEPVARAMRKRRHVAAPAPTQATTAEPAPAAESELPAIEPSQAIAPQPRVRRGAGSAPANPAPDAAELFAKARAAAMRGAFDESAALYTALQKRFAASPQAHVSRVLLGRMYLEQHKDARAALLQFDAYLRKGGPNRPEALLGRARALRVLGRVQEEVEALRSLVDDYPESLYVAPAEERLRTVQ